MIKQDSINFQSVSKKYFLQEKRTFKELLPVLLYGGRAGHFIYALNNINLTITQGETIGIIGVNGSGKSTLLKMIAGVSQPTKGKVRVGGRVSPLIELGAGFHPELSGRENIYLNSSILGITKKTVDKKIDTIIDFAELREFIDTPIKHYSSGMYMRLGFSVAVNVEPEILLVDEILAVGDFAFQQKCIRRMAEFKKNKVTIILVSHSMVLVRDFCQRVIWLENGRIKKDGPAKQTVDLFKQSLT
jgi:ABC-type polysaccharide/polyol phosphate transport system ATPase subunit